MHRFVALLALAGCGRISFTATDPAGDGGLTGDVSLDPDALVGHDEDNDGVPDSVDVCPHLGGTQLDTDADGVGDDCDPNLGTGRDRIFLFATMGPGDQPFTLGSDDDSAVWTQLSDSLKFSGTLGADQNLFGGLSMPLAVGDVRMALGYEVLSIITGAASEQNQIALAVHAGPPNYFVELNQVIGLFDNAQVTHFDGLLYSQTNASNLATGIHPGSLFFQTTQRVNSGVRLDASWPGEPYAAEVMDAVYQGATAADMNFNNLEIEIRWVVVITPE